MRTNTVVARNFGRKFFAPTYYNRNVTLFPRRSFGMVSALNEFIGSSGRCYRFKELLQEKPYSGRVWLATSGDESFVLKDVPEAIFSNYNDLIHRQLDASPYIRLPRDTIPNQYIIVYEYLTDDFLSLVRKNISLKARKHILKASLRGIAELHERDIVHLDIKPDNIMVDCYNEDDLDMKIERVQVTDLENAAYLPKGRCIKGTLPGNDNWRSPEGHLRGELNKPTDMFSFGAMCIYAMLSRVIFGADADFQKHEAQGALPSMIRLQRQVSYFADRDGFNGLIYHVRDDELSCELLGMLWDDRTAEYHDYERFSDWKDVDDSVFRDVVQKMMNLDPKRRLTAQQALDHGWFQDIEID